MLVRLEMKWGSHLCCFQSSPERSSMGPNREMLTKQVWKG